MAPLAGFISTRLSATGFFCLATVHEAAPPPGQSVEQTLDHESKARLVAEQPVLSGDEERHARRSLRRRIADRRIDALRADAARIRGLEWKRPVPAALLSRDELRKRMEAMIEKELDREELVEIFNLPLRREQGYYLVVPDENADHAPVVAFREWLLRAVV